MSDRIKCKKCKEWADYDDTVNDICDDCFDEQMSDDLRTFINQ